MRNRYLFGFILCGLLAIKPASSIYNISIQSISGTQINMDVYTGKRIIVIEFDPINNDPTQLLTLDSIQRANSNVQVIGVPAKDFAQAVSTAAVQAIIQNLNLSFVITKPAYVKKSSGANQQNIFKWLTHVNENSHFDNDVNDPGQIYFVNGEGTLYAMLGKGTSYSVIKNLAAQ